MKRFCWAVWCVLWSALAFAQAPSPPTHVRIVTGAASKVATYYVATTGNNGNPGTLASPKLTIAAGLALLGPGDTLYVRGGTYAENLHVGSYSDGSNWTTGAINVSAYSGETVWVRPGGSGNAIEFIGVSYHIWTGINVDGINGTSTDGGVYFRTSDHIRYQNAEIKSTEWSGMYFGNNGGSGSSYIEILNNTIHDGGRAGVSEAAAHGIYLSAVPTAGFDAHVLIEGNDIYGFTGRSNDAAIQVYEGAAQLGGGITIERNRLHGCGVGTFLSDAGTPILKFTNNLVYSNAGEGVSLFARLPSGIGIYNNTIYGNVDAGIHVSSNGPGSGVVGALLKNNIIYGNGTDYSNDGVGTLYDHNYRTADGNPLFNDAAHGDFEVASSSPVIHAGITLAEVPYDFNQAARTPGSYDIGAYQFDGVSTGVNYPVTPANTPPSVAAAATATTIYSETWQTLKTNTGISGTANVDFVPWGATARDSDYPDIGLTDTVKVVNNGTRNVLAANSAWINAGVVWDRGLGDVAGSGDYPTWLNCDGQSIHVYADYHITAASLAAGSYTPLVQLNDVAGGAEVIGLDMDFGAGINAHAYGQRWNEANFDDSSVAVSSAALSDKRIRFGIRFTPGTMDAGGTTVQDDGSMVFYMKDLDSLVETTLYTVSHTSFYLSYAGQPLGGGNTVPGNNHIAVASIGFAGLIGENEQFVIEGAAALAPEPFIVHTTLAPVTPCEPQTQVGNGGKGKFGCNPGGVGWASSYAGPIGQVPQHPDPVEGELLTGKDTVDVWVEVVHTDHPTDVKTTYRRSLVELGDISTYHGGRKPAGVVAIGDIEHGLGNEQGGFESATVEIDFSDAIDRLFRGLLEDQEIDGDEVRIKAASPTARAAEELPRVLYRGIAQTAQLASSLGAHLSATDWLFSEFGPFGPGAKYPKHKIPALVWMDTPRDSLEQYIPELYGEKSDEGAKNPLTNVLASKGLVPLIYVGREDLGSDSTATTPWEEDATIPTIPTPLTLTNVTFAGGDIKVPVYPWLAAVRNGKISVLPGSYTSTLNPGGVTEPDGIAAAFHFDQVTDGADYYIGWISDDLNFHPVTNPDVGNVGVGTHDSTTFDGMFSNDFTMIVKSLDNKGRITASDNVWDAYLVHMSAGFRILNLYGSDLGGGTPTNAHDRTLIDAANRTDVLHPDANWPFAERYREYTDSEGRTYWLTMIYARGPLSDDHKNGVCTMAVNAIGIEDVGDGTGFPLLDAEACKQHWLENKLIADQTSGVWVTNATAPIYEDGTFIVRSSSFTRARALLLDRVGGRGLTFGWYEDVPRDVVGDLVPMGNASTDCALGVNGHGQIVDDCFDEEEDTSDWDRIDHVTDVFGSITRTQGEERQNVATGSCDYDPDANLFRASSIAKNPTAIAKYKGREKTGEPLLSTMLNEAAHLGWVLQRKVWRLGGGEITLDVPGPRGWLDRDVGTGVLFNSIEGPGASGYVDQPMRIRRRRFNVDSQLTHYTLLDVGGLMVATDQQSRVTDVTADAMIVTDVDADAPLVTG